MLYDNPTNPFQGWALVTLGCAAVGDFKGAKCDFWARHPEPAPPNRAG